MFATEVFCFSIKGFGAGMDSSISGVFASGTLVSEVPALGAFVSGSFVGAFAVGGFGISDTEFGEYSLIVIPSVQGADYYAEFEANMDQFENYVGSGGLLELHGCTQSEQEWELWDGTRSMYMTSRSNDVIYEDHPMVENINSNINANTVSLNYIIYYPRNTNVVMENSYDRPVLIEYPYGDGKVIISTQTLEYYASDPDEDNCGPIMFSMIDYSLEFGVNIPPMPFSLESPEDRTVFTNFPQTLSWQVASDLNDDDTVRYTVFMSTDQFFTEFDMMEGVNANLDTSVEIIDLLNGEDTYWWKVLAEDMNGGAKYSSETWSFSFEWDERYELLVNPTAPVEIPQEFSIISTYPNPFNPTLNVVLSIPELSEMSVTISNVYGQQVATLLDGPVSPGNTSIVFNAAGLSSGIYLVQATVPGKMNELRKVVLVR